MVYIYNDIPSQEMGYLKLSHREHVENNVIELCCIQGYMDPTVTLDSLRRVYSEAKHTGLPIYIEENIMFSGNLSAFTDAIVNTELKFSIYTKNIEFLNTLNYSISKLTPVSKVLIIDTHNFYHRNFHSLPKMYDSTGKPTSLLKALSQLLKYIEASDYSHVLFATESKKSFRIDYTTAKYGAENAYKANRSETDPELKVQIGYCEEFLRTIGYNPLSIEGYEADDVIASATHSFSEKYPGVPIHVFTGDKDLCQLYSYPEFRIIDTKTKEILDQQYLIDKFGVTADKFVDYQAIVGDTSDNVIGVKGIGGKGAIELLEKFGTLEEILARASEVEKTAMRNKLEGEGRETAITSKELVFMRRHLLNDFDLIKLSKKHYDLNVILKELFGQYQIQH